jgi:phosphotriesterase-related protein
MKQAQLKGRVQTVLGIIDAESLGVTLPHEHLLADLSPYFTEPTEARERKLANEPVRLENLYWVKTHCLSCLDDMRLTDENLAIEEALLYKWEGGNTIVELSSIGLGRDPLGIARISKATDLNVIMGAGYYVGLSHPAELATMTEEAIAAEIVRDIMVGINNSEVRAGIIGEIGCSVQLEQGERKVLRACAIAQRQTGAAVNIHPGFSEESALEIIRILEDAGANLSRTVISHVDMFGYSLTTLRRIAEAGCYVEYDTFGHDGIHPPYEGHLLDAPSDMERVRQIFKLIGEGYINHILISSDTCYKHLLVAYGGYGYAHILRDVTRLMRYQGMSKEQIHTLIVENPKRLLAFA